MSSKPSSSSTRWRKEAATPSEADGPARRLAGAPGVQHVPSPMLDLFVVRTFLDEARCNELIDRIDAGRRESTIADDTGVSNFRTSETCDLDSRDPLVREVNLKLSDLLGIPPELGEPLQGQRYAEGQEFRAHTDTFNPGGYDYYVHTAAGGQRTWTAMVYLNEPEAGGGTRFKAIGNGQASGVEQPSRRAAQRCDHPPRDEGASRNEIHHHQVVSRAAALTLDLSEPRARGPGAHPRPAGDRAPDRRNPRSALDLGR